MSLQLGPLCYQVSFSLPQARDLALQLRPFRLEADDLDPVLHCLLVFGLEARDLRSAFCDLLRKVEVSEYFDGSFDLRQSEGTSF